MGSDLTAITEAIHKLQTSLSLSLHHNISDFHWKIRNIDATRATLTTDTSWLLPSVLWWYNTRNWNFHVLIADKHTLTITLNPNTSTVISAVDPVASVAPVAPVASVTPVAPVVAPNWVQILMEEIVLLKKQISPTLAELSQEELSEIQRCQRFVDLQSAHENQIEHFLQEWKEMTRAQKTADAELCRLRAIHDDSYEHAMAISFAEEAWHQATFDKTSASMHNNINLSSELKNIADVRERRKTIMRHEAIRREPKLFERLKHCGPNVLDNVADYVLEQ